MCYAEREILNGMKFDETHKTTCGIDFLHQLIVYVQFINVIFQFMCACFDTVMIPISYTVLLIIPKMEPKSRYTLKICRISLD
jgi:hypothetical protein